MGNVFRRPHIGPAQLPQKDSLTIHDSDGRRIWTSNVDANGNNAAVLWMDGSGYYGPVVAEDRSGFGIYICPDGTEIEGFWSSDQLAGKALVITPDGSRMIRQYMHDSIVSESLVSPYPAFPAKRLFPSASHRNKQSLSGTETPSLEDGLSFGERTRARASTPPVYSSTSSSRAYVPRPPSQPESWLVPFEQLVLEKRLSRHKCASCSSVYKASWLGKEVIVRIFPSRSEEIDVNVKELLNRMARVRHPNIALFMAASVTSDKFAIVTEFVPLNSYKSLPNTAQHVLHVAKGIAVGCAYLRRQGFAHKNLKPSNVLIDASSDVKLTDYFVQEFNSVFHSGPCLADTTVAYVAPEALRTVPFVPFGTDTAADVFSFGMLCWTMIAGREPYSGLTRAQIRVLVGYAGYREPRVHLGNLSGFTRLIDKCLAQDPAHRPTFERLVVALNSMHGSANSAAEDALITFISGR